MSAEVTLTEDEREWVFDCVYGAATSMEAIETVERIVAARVEQARATAPYWRSRFLRMRAMYRERFNEGLSSEDWHRKHCGLMNAHEVTADELAETLPDLLHAADDLPDDSPHQDTFRAVADAILAHYDVRTRP